MQRIRAGVYRCRQCGAEIEVPDDAGEPFDFLSLASGEVTERVVMVDGRELHRCPVPDPHSN